MSGLLFLFAVAAFVLIAYWAYRNDAMGTGENGSGLLAMRSEAPKPKPMPKWKKAADPREAEARPAAPAAGREPAWKRNFLHRR
jgi:hypothetical protein